MLINIEQVTKSYPPHRVPAVDGVTLGIPAGSLFGLLGPNGAGKTTLISMLVGLQRQDSGRIWFEGRPLESQLANVRAVTGFVPQELAFYPMLSVAENLSFYVAALGVSKAERATRIEEAVSATKLESHYRKHAQHLSGGLKRRLNLAIGLLNNPRVLFLDEPTVGIDPQSRNFILETIAELNRQRGMTVVYTSHYMEEVQHLCDRIAIIDHGRIILSGELQQLLDSSQGNRMEIRLRQGASTEVANFLRDQYHAQPLDRFRFALATDNAELLLAELPASLRRRGAELAGIRYGQQSLEDLYMAHTDSAPRE